MVAAQGLPDSARRNGPLRRSQQGRAVQDWHTADFTVYERPHRSVNRVLDSPFGGMFYGTYQPVGEGTRVHWRWEVEAQIRLARLLLPMHPLLARSMQQDLDALAKSFYPQRIGSACRRLAWRVQASSFW